MKPIFTLLTEKFSMAFKQFIKYLNDYSWNGIGMITWIVLGVYITKTTYSYYYNNNILQELIELSKLSPEALDKVPGWIDVIKAPEGATDSFSLLVLIITLTFLGGIIYYLKFEMKNNNELNYMFIVYGLVCYTILIFLIFVGFSGPMCLFRVFKANTINWVINTKHIVLVYGYKHTNFYLLQGISVADFSLGIVGVSFLVLLAYKMTPSLKAFIVVLTTIGALTMVYQLYLAYLKDIELFVHKISVEALRSSSVDLCLYDWKYLQPESYALIIILTIVSIAWAYIASSSVIKFNSSSNNIFLTILVNHLSSFATFALVVVVRPKDISDIIGNFVGEGNWSLGFQYTLKRQTDTALSLYYYLGINSLFIFGIVLLIAILTTLLYLKIASDKPEVTRGFSDKNLLLYVLTYVSVSILFFSFLGIGLSVYSTVTFTHWLPLSV